MDSLARLFQGTMEEKIYERQVTKLAIAKRVIDEHQIDRHYKENDLMELYKTNLVPEEPRKQPPLPKDRMFALQLQKFDKIIYKYHEHDSLLENKHEETLNEEEMKAAWEEFEAEKSRPVMTYNYNPQPRSLFYENCFCFSVYRIFDQFQCPVWGQLLQTRSTVFDQISC